MTTFSVNLKNQFNWHVYLVSRLSKTLENIRKPKVLKIKIFFYRSINQLPQIRERIDQFVNLIPSQIIVEYQLLNQLLLG